MAGTHVNPGFFVIPANGQGLQMPVNGGGIYRVNVAGTFTGTLSFQISQDGGATWSAASLLNMTNGSAADSSTTGTGSWLYMPLAGGDGILQVIATSWTSGKAHVAIVDLIANPQQIDVVLLPSLLRSGNGVNFPSPTIKNGNWHGVFLFWNMPTVSGATSGVTPTIRVVDPLSGQMAFSAWGSARTTTGQYFGFVYPVASGAAWSGGNIVSPLPTQWFVNFNHGDAGNYTYSLTASLLL